MNTMKRVLTLLLALAVILGMAVPVFASEVAASGTCGENLTWVLDGKGVLTVSGTGSMGLLDEGDSPWSAMKNQIKKVILNEGVTDIGYYAFYECDNLRTITIPGSVTQIRNYAFHGCDILTGVIIPDSVTYIGYKAFYNCDNLTKVIIPDSVQTLGWYAFGECDMMHTAIIGRGLTFIEKCAFYDCNDLWQVVIPTSITRIEQNAFNGCNRLNRICYAGTRQQWKRVWITSGNDPVKKAAYHYDENGDHLCDDCSTVVSSCQDQNGDGLCDLCGEVIPIPVPERPYKIANVVSGVHVYWKATEGAAKYGLWRSETGINGTYKWVANPTAPHFTDTKVQSGKTYYYKVTTLDTNSNLHSEKSPAVGITYIATPDITSRFNKAAGITLGWNKIEGATGYAIYRKSYSGSDAWVRVATIPGNATFTWQDTSVKNNNGTAYKYTIRALAGSNLKTLSGCRNAGRSMVRLTSRTLTSTTKAGTNSIKCRWNTSSAVTGYEIRFMIDDQVYRTFTVGNYATGVKTFSGLPARLTYKIQVRSYVKIDGMGFYSAWSTARTVSL